MFQNCEDTVPATINGIKNISAAVSSSESARSVLNKLRRAGLSKKKLRTSWCSYAGSELLEVPADKLNGTLDVMLVGNDLIREVESTKMPLDARKPLQLFSPELEATIMIYLPMFYYSEVGTANRLLRILHANKERTLNMAGIDECATADSKAIHYDETQLKAIKVALENKVLVLTGGPGTGKTTTTLGSEAEAKILLADPTGRAAKSMSKVTKMEAKTINRLLEMKPP